VLNAFSTLIQKPTEFDKFDVSLFGFIGVNLADLFKQIEPTQIF